MLSILYFIINPYPVNIFCHESVVCFLCLLHIFKCTYSIMIFTLEATTMYPDQTAPKGAV